MASHMTSDIPIVEFGCWMHRADRIAVHGEPTCGARWYQAEIDGHIVGTCGRHVIEGDHPNVVPFKKSDLPLRAELEERDGTKILQLVDKHGVPIVAIGWTP